MKLHREPLVTFFTIVKPFREPIATLQRNAIRSWTRLGDDVRVLVLGDEPGAAEAARDLGATHLPTVGRNEYGTPRMDLVFAQAAEAADTRVLCYINADILLLSDFRVALERVAREKRQFLMVGQRTDFDQDGPIDFGGEWEPALRAEAAGRGRLHRPTGIDYFAFTRGVWGNLPGGLPPMAIGRFVWDNWLIYRARQRQVSVIDASQRVLAIHQNHDYGHVQGGVKRIANGPEARFNMQLAGGNKHLFTIWDSTHVLTERGIEARKAVAGSLGGGVWSYRRAAGFGGI